MWISDVNRTAQGRWAELGNTCSLIVELTKNPASHRFCGAKAREKLSVGWGQDGGFGESGGRAAVGADKEIRNKHNTSFIDLMFPDRNDEKLSGIQYAISQRFWLYTKN